MEFSEKTIISEIEMPSETISKRSLKLIILSGDESIVKIADSVAQQEPLGVERVVIWIKNPDISSIVKQIPKTDIFFDDCLLFSLSTINKVGESISKNSPINHIRLDKAFIEAGKSEIN